MPLPTSPVYLDQLRLSLLHLRSTLGADALDAHADTLQLFAWLDLEPARPILQACYATHPRGGEPWDPIIVLRCLLVMLQVGQPSINRWVDQVRATPALRVACGFDLTGVTPGVGTLYDFLNRLHDGPRRPVPGQALPERPSHTERRRAQAPVPPGTKPQKKEEVKTNETLTARIVKELEAAKDQKRGVDLLQRLADILLHVAVRPSAERGLLGEPDTIVAHGDGSALMTGADPHGQKTCEHDRFTRCTCPRVWTDPDAAWGYVASLDRYFYGHHFYEISVSHRGHNLPLALRLDPGNASDFAQSLWTLDAMQKQWREAKLDWKLGVFIADAGHDAEPIYRYLNDRGITPVIPLRDQGPARHADRPELTLSPRGVPMCEAGVEMTPWGTAGSNHVPSFICPFKAGKLTCCPKAPESDPEWSCRPGTKYAPVVTVPSADNPRIFSPLPRNHPRWTEYMALRSGCERSNSIKKNGLKLEQAGHRRASFWLIRLHLCAVLQHARAWVASASKLAKSWLRVFLETGQVLTV